jgi:hypothetical protein
MFPGSALRYPARSGDTPVSDMRAKAHGAGCRRALVCVGVMVVALGVLGTHQLSWHYVFATAGASHPHYLMPADVTSHKGIAAQAALALPDTGETTILAQGSPLTAAIHGTCDGACENHQVVAGTCLLALTVLVIACLRPPRMRTRRGLSAYRHVLMTPRLRARRPRALTLVELSVRRT